MERTDRSTIHSAKPTLFERFGVLILLVSALMTWPLIEAAIQAVKSNSNQVLDWLPASYTETHDLRWFREHFPGDGFIVVSWDGCRLGGNPGDPQAEPDDPRIEEFAQLLAPSDSPGTSEANQDDRPAAEGESENGENGEAVSTAASTAKTKEAKSESWYRTVMTGRRLLDELTAPPLDMTYAAALERLRGVIVGPDGRQTCVIIGLSDQAIGRFREVIGRPWDGPLGNRREEGDLFVKLRACGIDPSIVHLGGPPVDNVAIDEEGERTLVRLAGLACTVGFVLAAFSLRSVRLTMIVFACGVLSAVLSLAAIWITGARTDAILMSMPALVYVLAVSGAVHIVNYYQTEVDERGVRGAAERAIAHGWRPAVFCSVTTALGLLSLYISELHPIKKFGLYSALGVVMTLLILLLFLPSALHTWPSRPRDVMRKRGKRVSDENPGGITESLTGICRFLIAHHRFVTAGCLLLTLVVSFGTSRVRTSIDLMKLFDKSAQIRQDYQWLEENVGRLVPMEIVVKFNAPWFQKGTQVAEAPGSPANSLRAADGTDAEEARDVPSYSTLLERMELVKQIQNQIQARFGRQGDDVVGPSLSAVDFVPALPVERRGTSAMIRRKTFNTKIEQSYDALLQSGYLKIDPADGAELWRISLRVAAFKDVDYAGFTDHLRGLVDPMVAQINTEQANKFAASSPSPSADAASAMPQLQTVFTGVVPIVYKAQRALLDSLIQSTIWSFLTITPLLMYVARGFRAGIVAMIPNILPVVTVFGGMGWLGLPVDIGSMMSASIALGVAVDDTIHYLTWFRDELRTGKSLHDAIVAAYQRCAAPTLQAALISGLGLSVFAFSTFTPTKQFGFLMLTILLAGVVAELIMLPALLAGPLGRVFADVGKKPAPGRDPGQAADITNSNLQGAIVLPMPEVAASNLHQHASPGSKSWKKGKSRT